MAFEIRIPRLGWTMEEGVFQGWLKEDGARIKSGDAIFVLEGEKVAQEIEATDDGVLKIGPSSPAVGSKVAVGDLIGYLLVEGEPVEIEVAVTRPDDRRDSDQLAATARPSDASPLRIDRIEPAPHRAKTSTGGVRISPRAAQTAAALGVDWTKIRGTGRTGRIRERDVMEAASGPKPSGDV